ncbi:uncharacterized protein LOC119018048 isoform X1 [Acanthopagrus latus]|uniref:uncharacterized protein LOC119018048 isoform X1 n=1 Tax=Acanthopagrus latus TaxID=8177 RepID=UPI00187C3E5B|nr:uncharacterized protein LOC119018048 isoform X1 [Acanthopagrus latus]
MDEPLLPLLALLDSGAECDSLDHQHFVQTGVKLELLEDLITALALNGSLLAKMLLIPPWFWVNHAYAEFQWITNQNLPNTFYTELDDHLPGRMTLFRQKVCKTGKTTEAVAESLRIHNEQELHDIDTRRTAVLHVLPVHLCKEVLIFQNLHIGTVPAHWFRVLMTPTLCSSGEESQTANSKEQKVVCSIFNGADAESRMVEIEESWCNGKVLPRQEGLQSPSFANGRFYPGGFPWISMIFGSYTRCLENESERVW